MEVIRKDYEAIFMSILIAANSESVLTNVYWVCLLLGFIWLAIQVFLADFSHDFGGGVSDISAGDMHFGIGDHAAGPDVHLPTGEITLSPVSPMIIAGFITVFGATGVVLHAVTDLGTGVIVLIAFASGFVGGFILWFLLSKIIRAVSGTSEARVAELIGTEAEVITPIRASGVGEIAYVVGGTRYTAPARSIDNNPIERNKIVRIVKIVGTTYFVKEETEVNTGNNS